MIKFKLKSITILKNIILYIWQLPQNLLGLILIFITEADYKNGYYENKLIGGISLGKYIIVETNPSEFTIKHEQGHQKQSLYLGWLYLFTIGILSLSGNIYDRIFHRNWLICKRISWYYNQPWEKWANDLSGIKLKD